ncbi:MAG: hypothetical protein JNM86_06865 [Phycisphaerae bacterium]|nr:hypothetical protein [Phycisphaerae bacterium]
MNKNLMLGAAALLLAASGANAELVTINFEDLAPGTAISNQYAPLGVRFATSPAYDNRGVLHSAVSVLDYSDGSFRTNAVGLWGSAIALTFDSDISNFTVRFFDTDRGSLLGRVRAYNAQGLLMAHVTDMTGNFNASSFYENTLRVAVGGIRFIELTADADGAMIDSISFLRVPSPGALAALPVGLLALAKRRRS